MPESKFVSVCIGLTLLFFGAGAFFYMLFSGVSKILG